MIDIQFRDEGTHLVVVCQGKWELDTVSKAATAIRDMATQISHTRILVDWRNVPGPVTYLHRFRAGEEIARILPPPFRVAALSSVEIINKITEDTAVDRGALYFVSHDEQDLLRWLLEGLPESDP